MLSFCVERHRYHMKIYVIKNDLLRRTLVLMKSKHKFLALSEYWKCFFKALCVLYGRCNSTNVHLNSEFLFICCVLLTTIKSFGKKEVSFFVEEQLSLSTDQCSFWWEEDCCLF